MSNPPGKFAGIDEEVDDFLGALHLFGAPGHHGRPLFVVVDEFLGHILTLVVIGLQQRLIAAALKHLPQLPGKVPAILDGDVHALARLGTMGMARVAGNEDSRIQIRILLSGDIVETLSNSVADLVDAEPGHFANVD